MSNKPKSIHLYPEMKSNHPKKRKRIKHLDNVPDDTDKSSKVENSSKNTWKYKIPKKEKTFNMRSALEALRQDYSEEPLENPEEIRGTDTEDRPKLKPCPKSKRTQPTPSSYDLKPADKNKFKSRPVEHSQETRRSIFEHGESIDFRDFLADHGPVTSTPPRNQNNTLPSMFVSLVFVAIKCEFPFKICIL